MVISSFKGGLGNQMFQYAAAIGISRDGERVLFDNEFYKNNKHTLADFTPRKYAIELFPNTKIKIIPDYLFNALNNNQLKWRILKRALYSKIKTIPNHHNEYIPNLIGRDYNVYLDGYFQSERYFKQKRSKILSDYRFPALDDFHENLAAAMRAQPNPVSLQVRRGDYMKPEIFKYHGLLPIGFYLDSIRIIEEAAPDAHYYIISDDVDWCRAHLGFLGDRMTFLGYIEESEAWKYMCLMSHCRHHIVPNSSFSWWGAWLSQRDGINCAPAGWFNRDHVSFDIHNIIPDSWRIIEHVTEQPVFQADAMPLTKLNKVSEASVRQDDQKTI